MIDSDLAREVMPPHKYHQWETLRKRFTVGVSIGRYLVLWSEEYGEALVNNYYKVQNIYLGKKQGLVVELQDKEGHASQITHTPTRLGSLDAYLHIPSKAEIRLYTPNCRVEGYSVPLEIRTSGETKLNTLSWVRHNVEGLEDLYLK